jgi:FkbH-like protein
MSQKKLQYPLNISDILRNKIKINPENGVTKNIAILGGSTTHQIAKTMELFLLDSGINANIYESEYNRYYEEALFEQGGLSEFKPDIIYIYVTNVNITNYPEYFNDSKKDIEKKIELEFERWISIWKALKKYNCPIIQNNFDLPIDRVLGNLDCYNTHGKVNFINNLNIKISKYAMECGGIYINDINYLSSYIGIRNWFDRSLWYTAKYAVSMEAIPELVFSVSKIINAILGKSKKCLVLDLDNTCWGGEIGESGLNEIQIGPETAISEAYSEFQKYIKSLQARGVILSACSKNDFKNAKNGFLHPNSVLNFKDFTSFVANFSPKNENIVNIAKEINISTSSLVFIDDNPVERGLVASQVPNVSVPNVGSNIVDYIDYIDKNGYYEVISLSQDDINRGMYYKKSKKMHQDMATFKSYNDFLTSLEMEIKIEPFSIIFKDRISQLINKTNQFNLTTKRYTTSEVESVINSDAFLSIQGRLSDKYGESGLVTGIIGWIKEESQCYIELWFMSCRVLKRGVEYAMFDELIKLLLKRGDIKEVIGFYIRTNKNKMVNDLYQDLGFSLIDGKNGQKTTWLLKIHEYRFKNKIIKVSNE